MDPNRKKIKSRKMNSVLHDRRQIKEDKILQVDMFPGAMGSIDGNLSVLLRKVD